MNTEIKRLVDDHKRTLWKEHLKTCDYSAGIGKLWSTVKSLSNPTKHNDKVSVTFGDKTLSDPKRCASAFCRQFIIHPPGDKEKRQTIRRAHKKQKHNDAPIIITSTEVEEAIKSAKSSKAIGPDGISTLMLKNLGPEGRNYLTHVFNLSLSTFVIPEKWKQAKVVPLLKPGKPANLGDSYRPISLLSPVAKTLENILSPYYKANLPFANHQHGFRKMHSTTTALNAITDHINRGLNQKKPHHRTVLVALDLSKAFDTVNHTTLLKDIEESSLPPRLKRWTANYMNGRQASVQFRNETSKSRRMKQGVPQGGVLSPILFNFYISKLPPPPEGVSIISYADDCTIMATGPGIGEGNKIDYLCDRINDYLPNLSSFFAARNLSLSPAKSTATIFTTWNAQRSVQLNVSVDGETLPTVQNPKILGVTFDGALCFAEHVTAIASKTQSRNKILKSLAGSTWGKDKEMLMTTFKAIGQSVLSYATPVWSPYLSPTNWRKLQVCQNTALRTATGCLLMTPEHHLHSEALALNVQERSVMLSKQFLLNCHNPVHPNNGLLKETGPPRTIRAHLRKHYSEISRYKTVINANNANNNRVAFDEQDLKILKADRDEIHELAVKTFIDKRPVNPVLNAQAPPIAEEELHLPRETRVTLAQLRSGYCNRLNSYLSRLNPDIPNVCPACGDSPHTTNHLFNCPVEPTLLTPESLWSNPVEAASFLGLPLEEPDDNYSNGRTG